MPKNKIVFTNVDHAKLLKASRAVYNRLFAITEAFRLEVAEGRLPKKALSSSGYVADVEALERLEPLLGFKKS